MKLSQITHEDLANQGKQQKPNFIYWPPTLTLSPTPQIFTSPTPLISHTSNLYLRQKILHVIITNYKTQLIKVSNRSLISFIDRPHYCPYHFHPHPTFFPTYLFHQHPTFWFTYLQYSIHIPIFCTSECFSTKSNHVLHCSSHTPVWDWLSHTFYTSGWGLHNKEEQQKRTQGFSHSR